MVGHNMAMSSGFDHPTCLYLGFYEVPSWLAESKTWSIYLILLSSCSVLDVERHGSLWNEPKHISCSTAGKLHKT